MTTPTLLPCPFCGSTDDDLSCDVDEYGHAYVVCGNCGAEGPFVRSHIIGSDSAIEQAAAAWNQRSAWQPIETAPGGGTEVLVWDWDGAKAVAAVSERDFTGDVIHWPVDEWGDKRRDQPPVHGTHWQPRLSPPPITP